MKSIGVLAIALVAGLAAAAPAAAKGSHTARDGGQGFHMTFGMVQGKQLHSRSDRGRYQARPAPTYRYGYRHGRRAAPPWAHPAWRRSTWQRHGWWGRHYRSPPRHYQTQGRRHR